MDPYMETLYFWVSCKCRDFPKKVPQKSLIASWICLLFSFISCLKTLQWSSLHQTAEQRVHFCGSNLDLFEASEMRATCALCHTVDFGVLFLRSHLLCTYQKSTSTSFFVPTWTLITSKLLSDAGRDDCGLGLGLLARHDSITADSDRCHTWHQRSESRMADKWVPAHLRNAMMQAIHA